MTVLKVETVLGKVYFFITEDNVSFLPSAKNLYYREKLEEGRLILEKVREITIQEDKIESIKYYSEKEFDEIKR